MDHVIAIRYLVQIRKDFVECQQQSKEGSDLLHLLGSDWREFGGRQIPDALQAAHSLVGKGLRWTGKTGFD